MMSPTNSHRPRLPRDLTAQLAAVPDTQHPDDDRDRVRVRRAVAALAVLAALVIVGVVYLAMGGGDAKDQRDAAVGQTLDLASQVAQACASGQLPPGDRLCAQAEAAKADPIPGVNGVNGQDGANGRDGRPGTDGTSPPCLAEPTQCRGVDGQNGTDGRDGTNGQDGKDGRDGTDGAPGRGVADFGPVRDVDEHCVLRTTYTDGTTTDRPARDELCPPVVTGDPPPPAAPSSLTTSSTPFTDALLQLLSLIT